MGSVHLEQLETRVLMHGGGVDAVAGRVADASVLWAVAHVEVDTTSAPTLSRALASADARTLVVGDGGQYGTVQSALDDADPGDLILIKPGTYEESLDLTRSGTADQPIEIAAETPGTAIIDAGGRDYLLWGAGSDIQVSGITFQGARNQFQSPAVDIVGDDWSMTDCIVQNNDSEGMLIRGDHIRLTRVTVQHNGQIGLNGAGCDDVLVTDCITRDNNYGMTNPVWAGQPHSVFANGLWYTDDTWEAGGGKWVETDGVTIDGLTSYDNYGQGIIFDYRNTNVAIRNSQAYDNHGLEPYEGIGIQIELANAGPALIENNLVYGNQGGDIVVTSSRNVTIRNNTIRNGRLLLTDWPRGHAYRMRNISVTDNTFDGSWVQAQSDNWRRTSRKEKRITIDHNDYLSPPAMMFQWGERDYSIDLVRRRLGFERNGTVDPTTPG